MDEGELGKREIQKVDLRADDLMVEKGLFGKKKRLRTLAELRDKYVCIYRLSTI